MINWYVVTQPLMHLHQRMIIIGVARELFERVPRGVELAGAPVGPDWGQPEAGTRMIRRHVIVDADLAFELSERWKEDARRVLDPLIDD